MYHLFLFLYITSTLDYIRFGEVYTCMGCPRGSKCFDNSATPDAFLRWYCVAGASSLLPSLTIMIIGLSLSVLAVGW